MATELQIIDAFEALRKRYLEENPSAPLPATELHSSPKNRETPQDLLQAWLQAVLGIEGATPGDRRRLRALVRLASEAAAETKPGADGAAAPPAPHSADELAPLLSRHPRIVEQAAEVLARLESAGLPPRNETTAQVGNGKSKEDASRSNGVPGAPAGEEASYWSRALPRLGGLRAWRFLEHLGRPVVVPDASIRRFLWRLGLIEEAEGTTGSGGAAVVATVQELARSTGMEIRALDRLMRWHTQGAPGLAGGKLCGSQPVCEPCPVQHICLWRRYGAREDSAAAAAGENQHEIVIRRWRQNGAETLDDSELLALLLHQGRNWPASLASAETLLRRFGGLRGVDQATLSELTQVRGVGETRAQQVKAALELGRRLSLNPLRRDRPITESEQVWLAFRDRFRHIPQEHFITLLLDTKNRFMRSCIVSKGTLDSSLAHPREVFKEAVRESASAIILMHNHPSGDPHPSVEDQMLTRQLTKAGQILGIRVLDHIILGSETYYSFRDNDDL